VFLLFIAVSGCIGVKYNNKVFGRYMLGCYAGLMVLVMIMEFAASITIFSYIGHLDSVAPTEALNVRAVLPRRAPRVCGCRRRVSAVVHPAPAPPMFLQQVVKGDYGAFMLVNQSFYYCCCGMKKCPQPQMNMTRDFCWIPKTEPYPCDSIMSFATFVEEYIRDRVEPVAGVALFLCLLQLFTSVATCCNQCSGRKQQEKDKISGPMSYDGLDGMYGEGEEAYAGGDNAYKAYAGYVKSGAVGRPGSAAAIPTPGVPTPGATAPPAPPRAAGASGAPPPAPPRK
jgi:hypothetical protein